MRLTLLATLLPAVVAGSSPVVTLQSPAATITGEAHANVERFIGVPFAQQPTGPLRLKPPQRQGKDDDLGEIHASGIARSCPQFFASTDTSANLPKALLTKLLNMSVLQNITNVGEDCLSVSIHRPPGTKAGDNLPVVFWIYGGGFEFGSTTLFDGTPFAKDAAEMGMPVVLVAVNHRQGGFGFLPGSEVKKAGAANLGLLDQRLALEWVADHIADFGGDPEKVTLWGVSSGAISIFDQMMMYDGDIKYNGSPLFRGAIMDSGSIVPTEPVDSPKAQAIYDTVVSNAGCSSADDTLECLRELDYEDFLNAATSVPNIFSYNALALSYLPRPDGTVLTQSPDKAAQAGRYASIPYIIGNQEDEGTTFAIHQSNITTTDEIVDYLEDLYFHDASRDQIQALIDTYQDISKDGAPFRTSNLNNWYPQFKRLAGFLGDFAFTLSRRLLLDAAARVKPDVKTWSYLASYDHGTPFLGTFHGSDVLQVFYGILPNYASRSIHAYYLSFIYDLDPNKHSNSSFPEWPAWKENRQLIQFFHDHNGFVDDDFRNDTYTVMVDNISSYQI